MGSLNSKEPETTSGKKRPTIMIYDDKELFKDEFVKLASIFKDSSRDGRITISYYNIMNNNKITLIEYNKDTPNNIICDFIVDIIYCNKKEFNDIRIYTNFIGIDKTIYNEKTIDDFKNKLLHLLDQINANYSLYM